MGRCGRQVEGAVCRWGDMEDKWREQSANGETWKTSGGSSLPMGRHGRQVEGAVCRWGDMEDKWREQSANGETWKTSGGSRLPMGRHGRQVGEQSADGEMWKTSGGSSLPMGRHGRQVGGAGYRWGEGEDKWRKQAANGETWKTSGDRRLLMGRHVRQAEAVCQWEDLEDLWREQATDGERGKMSGEQAVDGELWKTSGGRRLPTGSSGRQTEGEGCRQGAVEEKWREKAGDVERKNNWGGAAIHELASPLYKGSNREEHRCGSKVLETGKTVVKTVTTDQVDKRQSGSLVNLIKHYISDKIITF